MSNSPTRSARRDPARYPAHAVARRQPAYAGAKLPRWDSLSLIQKKLYAREAEVFAGYAAILTMRLDV